MASKLSLFLVELKRRKVTRVAVLYALVGLGAIEGSSMILPTLQLEAAYDYIVIFVLVGFPIALVLAWALEVTPQGIQKTADLSPEQLASQTPMKWRASSWILAGLGLVSVVTAGYFVLFRGGSEQVPLQDYVAVFPFDNLTGDPDLDRLDWYIAGGITRGLEGAPEVRQVAADHLEEVLAAAGDSLSNLEVAANLRVGVAVTGWLALNRDSLELSAEITRVADGELIGSVEGVVGPAEDPRQVVVALRDRVMGALAIHLDEHFVLEGSQPPTYEAFDSHRRGWASWLAGDLESAARHYRDSFQQDSTWLQSAFFLFDIYGHTQQFEERDSLRAKLNSRRLGMTPSDRAQWDGILAFLEGDLQGQYRAARFEYRKDPTGNALDLAVTALLVGRPREALEAMEFLDLSGPIWRESSNHWMWFPLPHHMLGSYEEGLEVTRQGLERFPEFLPLRYFEIRALVAMGRLEEIRPLLEQAERIEPDGYGYDPGNLFHFLAGDLARFGYPEESKALAQRALDWFQARNPEVYWIGRARSLILKEEPEEALEVLASLVEEDPENVDAHGLRGIALALIDDREGAEAEARWLEELDRPYLAGSNTYWRAAILAHLNRKDEAVRLLRQALGEGRDYLRLSSDPNFKPLWGHDPFEGLIAPRG